MAHTENHPPADIAHEAHADGAVHEHHGGSFRTYWIIAGFLGLATLLEVWLAEYLPTIGIEGGPLAGTMMVIALFKAVLVALFYMHLKYEKKILTVIFLIPFFLVSLLAFTLFAQP